METIYTCVFPALPTQSNINVINPQIMPSGKRAVFDSGRTISFHIKAVIACQQSSKSSATFKLEIQRDTGNPKRYDFEAESPKLARMSISPLRLSGFDLNNFQSGEIQDSIKVLKNTYVERTGGPGRVRRSRHVT
jgi:target of rapamycin complex 2 subunit MAPKAP1